MFEATTNPAAHAALKKAHAERSAALSTAWHWLFNNPRR